MCWPFESEVLIQREVVISVQLHLLGLPEAQLDEITEVLSFPHALGQCREFLREQLPHAKPATANSTAEAAELVAQLQDPAKGCHRHPASRRDSRTAASG